MKTKSAFAVDEIALTAYALDELNERERAAVEQTLACSPGLRAEVDEIRNAAATLQEALALDATTEPIVDVEGLLVRTARGRKIVPLFNLKAFAVTAIAAALAAVVAWQFWNGHSSRNTHDLTGTLRPAGTLASGDSRPRLPAVSFHEIARVDYGIAGFEPDFNAELDSAITGSIRTLRLAYDDPARQASHTYSGGRFNFTVGYRRDF